MRIQKRALACCFVLVAISFASIGAYALDAKMVRHTRVFQDLDMEIGLYWAQGYTPVGIEAVASGVDAGFWVLYAGDFWSDVTEWTIERYFGPSSLEAGIDAAAKTGWVPMDIAVDEFGENAYVLYLRMEKGMSEWRLEAARDEAGLEAIAERNAAQGLLPVGISLDGKKGFEALFVALPGHAFRQWDLEIYSDIDALEKQLEPLIEDGWILFGFLLYGGKAGIFVMR